jgi:undecaprenyl diphosphate synthase
MERAERDTQHCNRLRVRIAIDYSSRDALVRAAQVCAEHRTWSRDAVAAALPAPDVDLLIRTAGEQRLSDFLLWEAAYAEFVFTECLWPDFGKDELRGAVESFRKRDRKFGALPAA